jgi:sugar O-acyltransferase (sialic acid O-acetyltransferase NeuD family)
MSLPVIILGGGGHAKVLIEALRASNVTITGITDADPLKLRAAVMGIPVLGNDGIVDRQPPESIQLVNGIGSVNIPRTRTELFERFKARGFAFATIVHPSAVIASDAVLGEGAQMMAGAVIQPGCRIGMNSIVNTNATIDHDCEIGDHAHLSPGVTLSGGVRIGTGTHVGTGATVIQGIVIGKNCLVAAGAVVVANVPDGASVAGVPAKEVRS